MRRGLWTASPWQSDRGGNSFNRMLSSMNIGVDIDTNRSGLINVDAFNANSPPIECPTIEIDLHSPLSIETPSSTELNQSVRLERTRSSLVVPCPANLIHNTVSPAACKYSPSKRNSAGLPVKPCINNTPRGAFGQCNRKDSAPSIIIILTSNQVSITSRRHFGNDQSDHGE